MKTTRGTSGQEIVSAVGLLCMLLVLVAQPGVADDSEGAAKVIDNMLATLGGRDALADVHSLSIDAKCGGPNGDFRTVVKSRRPGKVYFHQTSDRGSTEVWSLPDVTWGRGKSGELKQMPAGVRDFVRNHEFHFLIFEIESRFANHTFEGADSIDGRPCVRLSMADGGDNPTSLWVDSESSLPLVLEMNPPGAEGSLRIQFSDWEKVEGVQYFKSFVLSEGPDRRFTYNYVAIEPNVVEEKLFDVPESINKGTPSPSRE